MELEKIKKFLACTNFAIAGVSRNKYKTGTAIYKEFKKQNKNIIPINPHLDTFEEEKCYASIKDIPDTIDALIIATKPEVSITLIEEAVNKGIKNIFLQMGSIKKDYRFQEYPDVNLIFGRCIFMFANPTGIHKFHQVVSKIFRMYPN